MPSSHASAEPHPLLARIAAHARDRADASALLCDGTTLSYGDLWARAVDIADGLKALGLAPGDRVAIRGERVAQTFVHILATLIAGAIYVPLGERAPPARQAAMLAKSGARVLLATSPTGDATWELLPPAPAITGEPAGYILFTSGSTGTPKGVQVTLDNVLAYVDDLQGVYPLGRGTRVAQLADLGFDASVHEIFGAWAAGAMLCVVPTRFTLLWPRYFRDLAIEEALLIPSQVRLADGARLLRPAMLPALRRVFLGAELVTGHVVRRLRATAPAAELVNLWGPTEGTVALTHHRIAGAPPDHEGVPIGRPWASQRLRLDHVEDGIGELIAAGSQICRGYWQLPAADDAAFERRDGVRFYRTGDLARVDPAHGYVFAGRRDRQIKIKGHRIELEECERAIRKHAGTDAAIVLADGDGLVGFVPSGVAIDPLIAALRTELPAYMVPSRFIALDEFPISASGKLDLARLRSLLSER